MSVTLLREMFERMVVAKDATLIGHYYHPDFQLVTNGHSEGYDEFAAAHEAVYATSIAYRVSYDEDAWVQEEGRVAGRLWITTERPDEPATKIEVVLIATFVDGRIHRLWELTWPDWSQLPAFADYG